MSTLYMHIATELTLDDGLTVSTPKRKVILLSPAAPPLLALQQAKGTLEPAPPPLIWNF